MDSEEEEEIAESTYEPQINAHNPAERIMARRLRIERRVEAIRKQKEAQERTENEEVTFQLEEVKNPVDSQVDKSMELLAKLKLEGEEYVTNVRVATEAREADRREQEGIGKEKLLKQLEEEAAAAGDMFNEIAEKWSTILKYNDPLNINDDIMAQKEKCDELIKQKDQVIAELRGKLRSAEINFGIDQRKQIDDVNSVSRRIEHQIIAMRKAYTEQLGKIEEVILAERQILIEANNKKWDELYKKRDQEEKNNAEKRSEDYWNFVKDMEHLQRDFGELYRETTIQLESDCDEMQRELERIKADSMVNSEKLDYNYQILKKREDENLIIRSQQKRRINKLQDVINSLRKKNEDYQTQTTNQIHKISDDLKKFTQSILDIEKKADHMAEVNNVKFEKIWRMNKKRADVLFNRILEIDKILYEQQLGLVWQQPLYVIPSKQDMESYRTTTTVSGSEYQRSKVAEPPAQKSEISRQVDETEDNPFYKKTLKNVLHLIVDKTGFLIQDELNNILKPYMEDERTLVKIDNVFSALNVTEKTEVNLLMEFFLPYMFCPICNVIPEKVQILDDESVMRVHEMESGELVEMKTESKIKVQEELKEQLREVSGIDGDPGGTVVDFGPLSITIFDKNVKGECRGPEGTFEQRKKSLSADVAEFQIKEKVKCQYEHPLFISSVFVSTALKEFLGKYHVARPSMPTMSARLSFKRSTISRMANAAEMQTYWKRYTEIFPKEREEIWDRLLEGLKKYHELLKMRKTTCEEVMVLRKQNNDLKRIFSNYIDRNDVPFDL